MEIASNNNAGINNNKVEFNYNNHRSTVWDCCINFTNKMFEYRQWRFSIENRDNIIESLYHLVRKHALTTQPKTKDFIDNIFKLYEKNDVKISMATLRVIEYMDDELLEAIIALYDIAFEAEQKGLRCYRKYLAIIDLHQLRVNLTSPSSGKYNPALDIYKMYKSK